MPDHAPPQPPPRRTRAHDIEATKADILAAALIEFAAKGLSGARVDEIAARTRTTKPAIYYHFGSKEGLYAAVLEAAYGGIRDMERGLALDLHDPAGSMRRLVEASFDYHASHPDWVRLVCVENIHGGRHIAGMPEFGRRNAPILATVNGLLEAGVRLGVFRGGVDPVDLHWMISSLCFYRVSNRHTWAVNFGVDMLDAGHTEAQRAMAAEAVLRFLARDSACSPSGG